MILLDRTSLSMKNGGWSNNQGYVYIHFTISELADTLHKSEMTIKNSLSTLEKADLICRERQGIRLPNKIYVKPPYEAFSSIKKKLSVKQKETFLSDGQKTKPLPTNKPYAQRNYESEEYESTDFSIRKSCFHLTPIQNGLIVKNDSWIELLRNYIQSEFVNADMCADFAIHNTDGRNPHNNYYRRNRRTKKSEDSNIDSPGM